MNKIDIDAEILANAIKAGPKTLQINFGQPLPFGIQYFKIKQNRGLSLGIRLPGPTTTEIKIETNDLQGAQLLEEIKEIEIWEQGNLMTSYSVVLAQQEHYFSRKGFEAKLVFMA